MTLSLKDVPKLLHFSKLKYDNEKIDFLRKLYL